MRRVLSCLNEGVAKLRRNCFLSDFAEIRWLKQIRILLRLGCLRQTSKIGESVKKQYVRVLQLPLIILFFCLSSCGYRFGEGTVLEKYQTISIPYAVGDITGGLTAALIKDFTKSGTLRYTRGRGDICLQVTVLDRIEDNVGFQYDRKKDGKREDYIIPNETRITAVADVLVIDTATGCQVLKPARISASVVFDHQYYFGSDQDNEISIGQLTDIDAARDSVQTPLNQALAKKIVDYVVHSW